MAALALALTACSQPEEKRSFTVPPDLCGTPVPAAALDAILPKSGKTLETKARSREVGYTHCQVNVDGFTVIAAFSEWKDEPSVSKVARSNPFIDLDDHTSEDGTYMWSEQGGARRIPCPVAAKAKQTDLNQLFIRILIHDEKLADADAAKDLLLAYSKSVADSKACTGAGS
ncbi:hypothetical protein ACWGI0_12580 [Streptomyces sp. NPDC054802]